MLAIIGSAPSLANLLLFSFHFAATALVSGSDMRWQAGALSAFFGGSLSFLAMIVFLVSLYREVSGRTSIGGRRKAAMVAAAVRVLGVAIYVLAFYGNRFMSTGMRVFDLAGSAAWIAFYVVFAREADPLSKRITSNLAAFLAALTAVSVAFISYNFYRQLTLVIPPLLSGYYLGILTSMFEQVCLFVFLAVVWRYRPAPPALGDRAQETL